ncbi:probable inactive histone-lysine N-methyltransferase SUVR2 isoform X1 [Papaver somniferum]|nr:probable inactive histone-lysine N-methyltransferase SUVR2 isoform X1 [Papaver somniferum]XP_026421242.1 probable inactive histone-lysine N-methyltransferase SUVR2 isoform X1 [Papaver somniferum]
MLNKLPMADLKKTEKLGSKHCRQDFSDNISTTMVPNQKEVDAIRAMTEIGLPDKAVRTRLKELLKMYADDWSHIERENYRALADYIFECEEHKEPDAKRVKELSFRAAPQLQLIHDVEASSSEGEVKPLSCKRRAQNEVFTPQLHLRDKRKEHISKKSRLRVEKSEHPQPEVKCKKPISCQFSRKQILNSKRSSVICLSNQKSIVHLDPKNKELTSGHAQLEVPISGIQPIDSSPVRNEETWLGHKVHSDSKKKNEGDCVTDHQRRPASTMENASIRESFSSDLEIASSELGEVKVSLHCNDALERPDFSRPDLDAILRMTEEKCLKSYKIMDPNFSIKKLMKDLCHYYLNAETKTQKNKGKGLVNAVQPPVPLKNSSVNPEANHVHDLTILESSVKSSLNSRTQIPRLLSRDGLGFPSNIVQPAEKVLVKTKGGNGDKDIPECSQLSNSRSLVVFNQRECNLDGTRPPHNVADISKGAERVKIPLASEVSTEQYPPSFYYIPRNQVYQNAYINFSLARIGNEDCCSSCFGDCVSSSIPCACARITGGEFAYTVEGLVKEKFLDECISLYQNPQKHTHIYCKDCPNERSKNEDLPGKCKGHLMRKFIKECWSKCGCDIQCGNRVVQRGITCNLEVFLTGEGKGWGIRSLENLPRGAFVCEYVGEIVTNTELYERNLRNSGNKRHTYPVTLDADWGSEAGLKDEEALCLDATVYGNVARFINHRCSDATLIDIPVEIETPDHHYYHIAFFTSRNVEALEELTWDYGIDFQDHAHPIEAFQCLCGSKGCRDKQHKTIRTKSTRYNFRS